MRMVTPYWNQRSLASDLFTEVDRFFGDWNSDQFISPSVFHEVHEDENHYLVSVDLPGMTKEDIVIEVKEGVLNIQGERKRKNGSTESLKVAKRFSLPRSVDKDKVEANYENGVLEIYLPKLQAAQAKKIEIQNNRESFFSKFLGSPKQ